MAYTNVVYIWDNIDSGWPQVVYGQAVVPYGCYLIKVTQDCVWDFGPSEVQPASVHILSKFQPDVVTHLVNIVPYCGSTMAVEQAATSISSLIIVIYYYDNELKGWVQFTWGVPMVNDTPVLIKVTEDCEWVFPMTPL